MVKYAGTQIHAVLLPVCIKDVHLLEKREATERNSIIPDLVRGSRPSLSDYQTAKDRPKIVVGHVIYPPADPNPSGPQYDPVDPAQTQWDRFL